MVSRRLLPAALGAALLVALPGAAAARQARTQTPASTFLMAAYIGPVQKTFPTVDISAGVNIYAARDALFGKLGEPALMGDPTPFTIKTSQMARALGAFAGLMSSPKGSQFEIGLYSINMSTGAVKAKRFDAKAGKAALSKLAKYLPAQPAGAIKRLRSIAFP